MHKHLIDLIAGHVETLYGISDKEVNLTIPDEKFGDYATSVALSLAGAIHKQPMEIAEELAELLRGEVATTDVKVVKPGFINMVLSDEELWNRASLSLEVPESLKTYESKKIVVEYSDPNPFKVLHVGHLYTSLYGQSLVNLLKYTGADVYSLNFGGDIGLHVAKTLWSIIRRLEGEYPEKLKTISQSERSKWMTESYIEGNNAYDQGEPIKGEIDELNKRIYKIHADNDRESKLALIYWECRTWSYDYFKEFYASLGIVFDKYYPESDVAQLGADTVLEQQKNGVFEESDGAIVYRGEKKGLHTRVFINAQGLPTYEAKDVGLMLTKEKDFKPDLSIIDTGNEQLQYMEVVLAAISEFEPRLVEKTRHVTHGMVKLKGGIKMSSRKGNILEASSVIDQVKEELDTEVDTQRNQLALGAISYGLLKTRAGSDIEFDPKQSVASRGNSGVYLQYTHARLMSIIESSKFTDNSEQGIDGFEPAERKLVRELENFQMALENSVNDLSPHHICSYLYMLAQKTNHFYEHTRVIDEPREQPRIAILSMVAKHLRTGLKILGIDAPNRI